MEQIDCISVTKVGDSLYLRLPRSVKHIMGVIPGTKMNVYKEGERLIFEKKVEE